MFKSLQRRIEKIKFDRYFNIYKKAEFVKDLPTFIQIEPTLRCNLHCATCIRDNVVMGHDQKDLSIENIERIVSRFPNLRSVKLQGLGETFLHPQIEEMLKTLKKRNIRIWIISNGTLFLMENIRRLVLQYVSDIAVSFDAVDERVFSILRKGADLNKIKQGIRLLVDERNREKANTLIGLVYVISRENYLQLEQLSDVVVDLRVDYVVLADIENWTVPGDGGFAEFANSVVETRKYSPQINKAVKKVFWRLLKKGIMVFYKNGTKKFGRCPWPFKSMFVTVEGLVTPCCVRKHREHAIGNIFETRSLNEIWNGEKYRTLRRSHICQKNAEMICAQCPD